MLVPASCLTSVIIRCRGFRQSCTIVDAVSKDLSPPLVWLLCLFSFAPFYLPAICVHDRKRSCPSIHCGLKGSWRQNSNTVLLLFRGKFVWLECGFRENVPLKKITFSGLQSIHTWNTMLSKLLAQQRHDVCYLCSEKEQELRRTCCWHRC